MREGLAGDVPQVLPVEDEPVDELEGSLRVADRDDVGELELDLAPGGAEQRADRIVVDRVAAEDARLIEQ